MNRTLLLLLAWSLRGRIVRSVRLLKQPRYIVGFLVFVLWFGGTSFRPAFGILRRGGLWAVDLPDEMLRLIQLGVAILLAGGTSLTWLFGSSQLSLGLTAAEIELLSSAPVSRRELIQHAIVKHQTGIAFGAAIMALLMGAGGVGVRLLGFVSFWLILTNGDLHGKGCALFKARLRELPAARSRALLLFAIALGIAFWTVVVFSIVGPVRSFVAELPAAMDGGRTGELLSALAAALAHGAQRVVLFPFLALLEPLRLALSSAGGESGRIALFLAVGCGLALVQNEWVVRSQFKFEESALEHARQASLRRDPRSRYLRIPRSRRVQVPFALPPRGAPGLALLWKSVMQVGRASLRRNAAIGAALAVAIGLAPWLLGAPEWVPATMLVVGFVILALSGWIMPLHTRNDLRSDLVLLEVIRPWPVPAWQVFAWEVLGAAVGGMLWAGLAACLIIATDVGMQLDAAAGRVGVVGEMGLTGTLSPPLVALGFLPVAAATSCLTAVLINLVVLYMPGWIQLGARQSRGVAAFGHNILISLGLLLSHGLALGAAALLVGPILLLQLFVLGLPFVAWELPLLGLVAALPPAAAAAVGVRLGGFLWDGLDPSREVLDPSG